MAIDPGRSRRERHRRVFLKGSGWADLWPELLAMLAYFSLLAAATAALFRKGVK
jgi:hypothetical protein